MFKHISILLILSLLTSCMQANLKDELEFDLSLFLKNGTHFERHIETHHQKIYDTKKLETLYGQWFETLEIYYDFEIKPSDEAERILYILRKR